MHHQALSITHMGICASVSPSLGSSWAQKYGHNGLQHVKKGLLHCVCYYQGGKLSTVPLLVLECLSLHVDRVHGQCSIFGCKAAYVIYLKGRPGMVAEQAKTRVCLASFQGCMTLGNIVLVKQQWQFVTDQDLLLSCSCVSSQELA
jgi:hypothetical protein